jgi:diguanylate cyclase (GGDEF)-like protein/PAS domain S-box-containing protein
MPAEPETPSSEALRLVAAEALAQVGTCELRGEKIVTCSAEFLRIHGFADAAPADIEDLLTHVDPRDRDAVSEGVAVALASGTPYSLRYRVIRRDGTRRIVGARGTAISDGSGGRVIHGAVHDITEKELAVDRLVAAESRYSAIVEHANDGIWILNRHGLTTFVNRRLTEMLGYPAAEMLGRPSSDFTDRERSTVTDERRTQFECRFLRRDGRHLWALSSRSELPDSHGGGVVLVVTDITARRQMEERLRYAAENDPLTGLMNRTCFERTLDGLLDGGARPGGSLALLLLDLDHFRYVNDAFGHGVGDAVLRELAEHLRQHTRVTDVLARFAGDEFVIALPGAERGTASAIAERYLTAIRDRRWQTLSRMKASIGLALVERGRVTSRSELLVAAGSALQNAKSNGRDQVAIYSGEGGRGAFHWIDEIRAALDEDRFVLHGQAIVPIQGEGARRYELLLRMVDRDGALIPPGSFIPVAEQFGMMTELDQWVIRHALELARRGIAVEINLSGVALGDSSIRKLVEAGIANGVLPGLLTFEVTETAAVRNIEDARSFAEQLNRLGCAFALDDFGTGYGSLVYLKNLPVSQLKIDIEFVRDLVHNAADQRLVRAIVQMAKPLGLETVAEGVENQATLDVLREIGVDFAQGFHIHRPAPLNLAVRSQQTATAGRPSS